MHDYKCWKCDNVADIEIYEEPNKRVFCKECSKEFKKEKENLVSEYVTLKNKVMFENALRTMEKSKGTYMHEYKCTCEMLFKKFQANPDMFLSSHEIIAAIILTDFEYEFEANKKIGKYKVDFVIPELFVCLEIDGNLHEHKLEYDNSRDIDIRHELGSKWEVIRIKTKFLEETPTILVEEIEHIYSKKKKLRVKNNGIIPEHFSKREAAHYKSILGEKVKTIKVL